MTATRIHNGYLQVRNEYNGKPRWDYIILGFSEDNAHARVKLGPEGYTIHPIDKAGRLTIWRGEGKGYGKTKNWHH